MTAPFTEQESEAHLLNGVAQGYMVNKWQS